MDKNTLKRTALAAALGISRQAVHRYEKQGMPCDTVEAAKAWRDANVQPRMNATETATQDAATASTKSKADPDARNRSGEGGGNDRLYWRSRGRREKAEASIAEMREAELTGTLINKAGAERAIAAGFRFIRDSVLAVPDRLPIDRALAIQLREAIAAALADAVKIMPSLPGKGGDAPDTDAVQP